MVWSGKHQFYLVSLVGLVGQVTTNFTWLVGGPGWPGCPGDWLGDLKEYPWVNVLSCWGDLNESPIGG